ncbi:MAG: hypothetical protein IPG12_03715 [Saprospiraceae bacterium]|nr:hypothetical protein [Saprospiraceae bacterium]
MEEVYIAYFDFLGFKKFIFNNEDSHISKRMGHIFRDIEMCLGQRNFQEPKNGIMLSDLSKIKINCLNISDTVIYWTNDCEDESLQELIKVSYEFNWMEIKHNFPLRGSLVKGKLKRVQGSQTNTQGGSYAVDCLFGSGIVNAHLKTENQN